MGHDRDTNQPDYIWTDPDRMGGTPCFAGTRVPIQTIFENLADGMTLDEVFENWPSVDPEHVRRAIRDAGRVLEAAA